MSRRPEISRRDPDRRDQTMIPVHWPVHWNAMPVRADREVQFSGVRASRDERS